MSGKGRSWSSQEIKILQSVYPDEPWSAIAAALPGRTRKAVESRAGYLAIKRQRKDRDILKSRRLHPLVNRLCEIRYSRSIPQRVLANRVGHGIETIFRWENGRNTHLVWFLSNWAEALGYELVLRPRHTETERATHARNGDETAPAAG